MASICNHSCDPNTGTVYSSSGNQLTFAVRCIKKGEEICHVYQGHHGDTDKDRRQKVLKGMFHFDCCCHACQNDYPKATCLPSTYLELIKEGDGEIRKQALRQRDEEHKKITDKIFDVVDANDVDGAINLYCERLRLAKNFLDPPHLIYLMGRAALMDCLWIKYGNRERCDDSLVLEGVYI